MKLFSWLNDDSDTNLSTQEDGEATISPVLQKRLAELEKLKVSEVMIPRALITGLDADVQLRHVRHLKSAKVAFFPVYKGDLDHILGWISKARVLDLLNENSEENTLSNNVRPVGSVSEDASVAELADLFLKTASPFLVVKNPQSTTTGIIPLSEFVELIFGFELTPQSSPPANETVAPMLRGYEL